jgi:DNA-binding transcriptional LysR family regulator
LPTLRLIRLFLPVGLLLLAACDAIPQDPDRTLDHVRKRGEMRVGMVAPPSEQAFLRRVTAATGALLKHETGSTEDLLSKLEQGELDLVLGEFHASSPWSRKVSFVPSLSKQSGGVDRMVVAAAARNGENRWIAFLHEHSDELKAKP